MVPSCTVMPYIQTRATTEISMREDVMQVGIAVTIE